eukprot:358143-Chlamydomonas_euryale.AAC.3
MARSLKVNASGKASVTVTVTVTVTVPVTVTVTVTVTGRAGAEGRGRGVRSGTGEPHVGRTGEPHVGRTGEPQALGLFVCGGDGDGGQAMEGMRGLKKLASNDYTTTIVDDDDKVDIDPTNLWFEVYGSTKHVKQSVKSSRGPLLLDPHVGPCLVADHHVGLFHVLGAAVHLERQVARVHVHVPVESFEANFLSPLMPSMTWPETVPPRQGGWAPDAMCRLFRQVETATCARPRDPGSKHLGTHSHLLRPPSRVCTPLCSPMPAACPRRRPRTRLLCWPPSVPSSPLPFFPPFPPLAGYSKKSSG